MVELGCEGEVTKTELGQKESLCDCAVDLGCEGGVLKTELGQSLCVTACYSWVVKGEL